MSTFRIEDGVPYAGDKAYRWASKVSCDEGWPWRGFHLLLENAWEITVLWHDPDIAIDVHQDPFKPFGDVAAVDAAAIGLLDQLTHYNPETGGWPHGTPFNWAMPRTYVKGHERLDDIIAEAAKRFSPTWPIESVRGAS